MSQWIVYSKPDCPLCDEMQVELAELLGSSSADVRVVDISGDPELERLYAKRIPALSVDGALVCYYRLNRDRVLQRLQQAPPSSSRSDSGG